MEKKLPIFIFLSFSYLTLFFYYPIGTILYDAFFTPDGQFTLKYILEIISGTLEQRVITFTVYQAFLSTLLTLALGLPGAYIFSVYDFKGKELLRALVTVPFVLPSIVVALGFLLVFGPYGYINQFLMWLLGFDKPVLILDGLILILLAHAFYNIPVVIQMVSASWERIDPAIEEAAEILGGTGFYKFRKVILPQIINAILSSALLTYIFTFLSFTIVITLGGVKYRTIEVHIYSLYKVFLSPHLASALAVLQLLISLTLAYFYTKSIDLVVKQEKLGRIERYLTRKVFSSYRELLSKKGLGILSYSVVLFILFVGPLSSVFVTSLWDIGSKQFTLTGYQTVLEPRLSEYLGTSPFRTIVNSLFFATLTVIFSLVLGSITAYLIVRYKWPGKSFYSALILLPLGVSSITLALGIIRAFKSLSFFYYNEWLFILIAHVMIGYPFAMRAIANSLQKVDPDLLDASQSLGASKFITFFYVELPLIIPGVIVGGIFAFAMSIGEMAATLFLAPPEFSTMTVSIYKYISVRKYTVASAMGSILIIISMTAFILLRYIGKKGIAEGF